MREPAGSEPALLMRSMATYAIIALGGKQYRVTEGEYLFVDRLPHEEGSTFEPRVLMVGGDGEAKLGEEAASAVVTVRVTQHLKGKKVIVGKHRQRVGYRKRNGFRARLSRIDVVSIGSGSSAGKSRSRAKSESEE